MKVLVWVQRAKGHSVVALVRSKARADLPEVQKALV